MPQDNFNAYTFEEDSENDQKMREDVRMNISKLGDRCFNLCVGVKSQSFKYSEQQCVKNCVRGDIDNIMYLIKNEEKKLV